VGGAQGICSEEHAYCTSSTGTRSISTSWLLEKHPSVADILIYLHLGDVTHQRRPLLPGNNHSNPNGVILYSTEWTHYAADLPAISFAFSGTFCLFPVYSEMHDKSMPSMKKVIGRSTFVCSAGYMLVALFGVWTFGSDIDTNPVTHQAVSVAFFCWCPQFCSRKVYIVRGARVHVPPTHLLLWYLTAPIGLADISQSSAPL
jgi:hypothetical protein